MFNKIKNFFKRLFKKEKKESFNLETIYNTLDSIERAHASLINKLSEGYFGNGIIMSDEEMEELKNQINTIKSGASPDNKKIVEAMEESLNTTTTSTVTDNEAQKIVDLIQMSVDIGKIKKSVDNALFNVLNSNDSKLFENSIPKSSYKKFSSLKKEDCCDVKLITPKDGVFRYDDIYDKTSPHYGKEITFVDDFPEEYINHLTCLQKDAFASGFVVAVKSTKGEVIYFCKNRNQNTYAQISFLKRLGIEVPDYYAESETERIWRECEERAKANENSKKEGE